ERVHVRVDLAEDTDDARLIEADVTRVSRGIPPEIEHPRLGEGKDVVVELVGIGKVDRGAGGDCEYVRYERLVALVHHRLAAFVRLERTGRRRFQIGARAAQIRHVAPDWRAEIADSRPPFRRGCDASQVDASADGARSRS